MTADTAVSPVTVLDRTVRGRDGGISVRDYEPTSPRAAATPLLWVHGGGFTTGGLDQKESDAPARALAAAGRFVRTVAYRLVPQGNPFRKPAEVAHPNQFPAALHDVVDVAAALQHDTGRDIALGGASAGANLAAAATLHLRDHGRPTPRTVLLAYGVFHAALPADSEVERDLRGIAKAVFRPPMVRNMNLNYVRDRSRLVPGYAFPGGSDLSGFPPTLIMDASNDRLRASGAAFSEELSKAGTEVHRVVVPANHAFLNSPRSSAFSLGMNVVQTWLAQHDTDPPR